MVYTNLTQNLMFKMSQETMQTNCQVG